jgi:Flp pilus assembly protein TadB
MGYYYERGEPEEERPPGCLDAIAITRAVFAALFWPIAALFVVLIGIAVTVWLLLLHPALALIPISLAVAAVLAFARWDQRRHRPPDA